MPPAETIQLAVGTCMQAAGRREEMGLKGEMQGREAAVISEAGECCMLKGIQCLEGVETLCSA